MTCSQDREGPAPERRLRNGSQPAGATDAFSLAPVAEGVRCWVTRLEYPDPELVEELIRPRRCELRDLEHDSPA